MKLGRLTLNYGEFLNAASDLTQLVMGNIQSFLGVLRVMTTLDIIFINGLGQRKEEAKRLIRQLLK